MSLKWYPQRLNATITAAYRASLAPALADAQSHAFSKSGAVLRPTGEHSATLAPTGIGAIQEQGARPHIIQPKKGFLYLKGDNAFVSGPVEHPGSPAEPFLRPAALRWANGGFQATARGVLAAGGFR